MSYAIRNLSISEALTEIGNGTMRLPDFQRPFVWSEGSRRQLVDSIQKAYPVGALLFLEIDPSANGQSPFGQKHFHGVKEDEANQQLRWLVLDGQQRLTTVFNAFSLEALPIPATRPKWLFLDLKSLYTWTTSSTNRGKKPDFVEHLQYRPKTAQPDGLLFSSDLLGLPYIAEGRVELRQRLENYAQNASATDPDYANWVRVNMQGYFDPILEYKFPCVVLPASLDLEAVANVFTILNQAGVKLTAFDLCVSKFFPHNVPLRDWWQTAKTSNVVGYLDKDGTSILQTIALIVGVGVKKAGLVKNLEVQHLNQHWQRVVDGFETVGQYFAEFGITSRKSLPYDTIIPAIVAAHMDAPAPNGPVEMATRKSRMQRWIFQTAFNQRYTEGSDAKKELDYPAAKSWLAGDNQTPGFLENDSVVWPENMPHISNSGARYKAFTAMINQRSPFDFIQPTVRLGVNNSQGDADVHHIFPKAFLRRKGLEASASERAFNMTFLSGESNRLISDQPPSVYLNSLIESWKENAYRGMTHEQLLEKLQEVMSTHFIDAIALRAMWADDYEGFLKARANEVRRKLESIGVPVLVVANDDEEIEYDIEIDEGEESDY